MCVSFHVCVTVLAAIHSYPTVKCFVSCIKDRLPDGYSCLNLHPCLIKFSQSVSLWFTSVSIKLVLTETNDTGGGGTHLVQLQQHVLDLQLAVAGVKDDGAQFLARHFPLERPSDFVHLVQGELNALHTKHQQVGQAIINV